ncbi:MAG TPA: serine/threonine-protein kinase PknH/PknJ [Mycobacterium sp.]|uniref:serine/threonine-protein kinase PknH/PknJ n=1 Tax=Mycobacterium sp. TaxID=1785 RepID=UPI002D533C94|nr:serine/threonine-protein kinase PknH/PknJ [Mycobacterium sp.]HZU46853.1 serine/threonine-protein kinase PknH/PknJ [Mycobacterium sp.]
MLTAGTVVAGYRIERVLGTGGMGAVYLAANPNLPRYDALKVLSAELSRDPDFRARFIREADVAAALDHPNIVSVYNRGQTESGELWIAMQYVDGTDADDALRAATMTPQRAVYIVGEVAKALDYAHAHNLVHRDVKPANFLLSGPIGPSERVLLGDFGIARALDDVGLTVTGSVMATVAYAAPEVLAGLPFDGRADLYSLGCTLFRLLTGKTPFSAANGMAAVMLAHLQQPPPRVTDLVPSLPVALDAVIATAMAKDPAMRFPSAAALADAASAALTDRTTSNAALWQPVPSGEVNSYPLRGAAPPWWQHSGPRTAMGPPGTGQGAAGKRGQPRRTAIVAALAAVVVLVTGIVTAVVWPRDQSTPPPAAGSNQRAPRGPAAASPQAPPATDVPAEALRSILLTAAQITAQTGGEPVVLEQDSHDLFDDSATVDTPECLGAWAPAQRPVYTGRPAYFHSAVAGVAAQVLRAMNKKLWQDGVMQAVATFSSDSARLSSHDLATTFVQEQQRQWDACAGRTVVVTPPGEAPQTWQFGRPSITAGALTLDMTLRGAAGSCQRGMMVAGNVVIDIRQCRSPGGNDASALVKATADKVPRQ